MHSWYGAGISGRLMLVHNGKHWQTRKLYGAGALLFVAQQPAFCDAIMGCTSVEIQTTTEDISNLMF